MEHQSSGGAPQHPGPPSRVMLTFQLSTPGAHALAVCAFVACHAPPKALPDLSARTCLPLVPGHCAPTAFGLCLGEPP